MARVDAPDKLLDLIYDAATEPELWVSVNKRIADLTSSQGCLIFGFSVTIEAISAVHFEYNGGFDDRCITAFKERHLKNPWAATMGRQPAGRLVMSDGIISLSELKRTSFFDEVLRPLNVAHNAMSALAAKDEFRVAFNICRSASQGPFEEHERQTIEHLLPDLRRSLHLGFRLDGYRALQSAQYHVLDRLTAGVILLDRRSRIIYANRAARSFGAPEGALRLRSESLSTHSSSHTRQLQHLIEAARRGAASGAMSLPLPGDGRLLTVLVTSMRSRDLGRFNDAGMRDAAVLVHIVDAADRLGLPAAILMQAYELTQAEAKVALAASSGATIAEAATQLDLSPNTIKTHLRKVYAKTGVTRQAELARLIASVGLLGPR